MLGRGDSDLRASARILVSSGLIATLLACGGASGQDKGQQQAKQPSQTPSPSTYTRGVPAQQKPTQAGHHDADTRQGRPVRGMGSGEEAGIIGGASAAAVGTMLLFHHHEHKLPKPEDLSSSGPQLPHSFDMNHFVVDGYLGPNWPVALDFTLTGPGAVKLDITAAKGLHYTQILTNTLNGRGIAIVYPQNLPDKVLVASFDVESVPPAGSNAPAPTLRVYGMGAGPKAVGSIAIDEVTFGPSAIRLPDPAQYGFHSHSDFSNVRADFIETGLKDNHIIMKEESEDACGPVAQDVHAQGTWGLKPDAKRNPGQHMLQIRAWRGYGSDWVVAWSPDIVDVTK